MSSFQETYNDPIGQSCLLGTSLVGPAKKKSLLAIFNYYAFTTKFVFVFLWTETKQ